MKLADVSIARPVFATMMIVALLVLGLFSYTRLNVDMFPDVDVPVVMVRTILPGAGPEQMETDVTRPIEDAVNPIGGVDHIDSRSLEGLSLVVIQFELEVDGQEVAQEVREKIAAIRSEFPTGTEDPIIERWDPDSQPIIVLTVFGDRSPRELTTYTKDVIRKRLESVRGVGLVELVGGSEREVQVEVDADRLEAYSLSIDDVIGAVGEANVELPGGNITRGNRELLVRTLGRFRSAEEFESIVLISEQNRVVRLRDVARVIDGVEERESLSRYNGEPSVSLEIRKQSGANTVDVADRVLDEYHRMQKDLPSDIRIEIARDDSDFIRRSIEDVLFDIAWGGLLAVLVVYFFLANLRSTIISAIALPTSIIATFALMYALGFTLNVMSLMGLSLAVGLLIDDAIVVIENIYRHMHEGRTAREAAHSATAEIGLAVMAITFTLVAVFVPVAFMQGIIGRFFFEFGITISVAVIVSLFVAFSLTPMLSSRWLRREDEDLSPKGNLLNRFLYWFNHGFHLLNGRYRRALDWTLHHRKTVSFFAFAAFVGSLYLFRFVGSEFFPGYDQGEFSISIKAPPGSSLEQTDAIARHVENLLRERSEVTDLLTSVGAGDQPVNEATVFVKLVDKSERAKSVEMIASELRPDLARVPGTTISVMTSEGPGGGNEKSVGISVRGPDLSVVEKLADKVERIVAGTPGTVEVETSLESSKPELRIRVDRERATDLGVGVQGLAGSVRSMVDGYVATQYQEGDEQYDVRVRLQEEDRQTPDDIARLAIATDRKLPSGRHALVRLGDVASVREGVGPTQIDRYDRQKEILVSANLSGRLLGDVLSDINAEVEELDIPPGYNVGVVGEGEMQAEAFLNMFMSMALAVIFVYIILAMQFESFLYPLSIMFSLPMAIVGAVLSLIIFGESVSIMSMIGIILLMGLVTKNAILLIDYTNQQRASGLSRTEALLKAGPTRLRPILMTTFAMIFGMLPVALALGEGSEFRAPMGITVIGGLITSTLLTLFIVPVVYTYLDDLSWRRIFSPIIRLARVFVPARSGVSET